MLPLLESFDSSADLWNRRLAEAMGKSVTVRLEGPQLETAQRAFESLRPMAVRVSNFFLGRDIGAGLPNSRFIQLLNFFPRLFQVPAVDYLPEPGRSHLVILVQRMELLGLTSHLLLFSHPARPRVALLDANLIINDVLEGAPVAEMRMKDFDREVHGASSQVESEHFLREVRPALKATLQTGFFKTARLKAHFTTMFWTGAALALRAETLAGCS
jgi:hypothetical protein